MDSNIVKTFKKASFYPKNELSKSIFFNIILKEKRNDRIKLWIYSTIGGFSFISIFVVAKQLFSDFASSGFYDYLSLAFSNSKALFYWKEIILSLTESLPVTDLILTLTLVFVFILSLRFMAHHIRNRTTLSIAY